MKGRRSNLERVLDFFREGSDDEVKAVLLLMPEILTKRRISVQGTKQVRKRRTPEVAAAAAD